MRYMSWGPWVRGRFIQIQRLVKMAVGLIFFRRNYFTVRSSQRSPLLWLACVMQHVALLLSNYCLLFLSFFQAFFFSFWCNN